LSDQVVHAFDRLGHWALIFLPGGLIVFLSFHAGGFFPGTPALVAVLLSLVLIARIVVAPEPFAGFSPSLAVAGGALGLYTVWTLLSAAWSDSTARALIESDRALMYLLALVLYGSIRRDSDRVRWMTRGVAVAFLVVCGIGLITRLLPDVWPIAPDLSVNRLSYPVTYWNTLGLMAAIGTILSFHFASSRSEPSVVRVVGAGAVPVLTTALFFTFSRGAIVAGAIGLAAYIVLGRPRALISGLLATVPASTIAVVAAYHADKLASQDPTSTAATSQGHDVAFVLAVCIGGAMLVRFLLLRADEPLGGLRLPSNARLPVLGSLISLGVIVVIAGGLALHAPSYVSDQWDRFLHGNTFGNSADQRTTFTDPGGNGRADAWKVAIDHGFEPAKLDGHGAGTYQFLWNVYRPKKLAGANAEDAHSLYIETLGELGLVGFVLIVTVVVAVLYGFAARFSGPNRTLYAALFAAALAWALRAGVDWDWEMPAVTLWVFALGGAALAVRRPRIERSPSPVLRACVVGGVALICVLPTLLAISQAKLGDAVQAFLRNEDCGRVIDLARSANPVVPVRPEPYRLQGYCQARLGENQAAVDSMSKAVDREPDNWEYRYSLAVAQAAAGVDPRPAAREALRLDPLEPQTAALVSQLSGSDPAAWRKEARPLLEAPLL